MVTMVTIYIGLISKKSFNGQWQLGEDICQLLIQVCVQCNHVSLFSLKSLFTSSGALPLHSSISLPSPRKS